MTPERLDFHHARYERIAKLLGLAELKALVPFTGEELFDAVCNKGDGDFLESLPYVKWFQVDPSVRDMYTGAFARYSDMFAINPFQWKPSHSVCLLKHVAYCYVLPEWVLENGGCFDSPHGAALLQEYESSIERDIRG